MERGAVGARVAAAVAVTAAVVVAVVAVVVVVRFHLKGVARQVLHLFPQQPPFLVLKKPNQSLKLSKVMQ